MSFTVNLSGGGLLINRFNSSNMLKSTQEKLQQTARNGIIRWLFLKHKKKI